MSLTTHLSFAAFACLCVLSLAAGPKQKVGDAIKEHRQTVAFARVNPAKMLTTDPLWVDAAKEVYAEQGRLKSQLQRLSQRRLGQYVVRRGDEKGLKVALTFDDGPHPNFTPKLVEILKSEGVPATFFVIGHMAESYPDMVKLLDSSGFEVANHTYSHVTLTKLTDDQAETEYRADNDVVRKITGKTPRYCRPPGGDFDLNVLEAAASQNLKTVLWTDDPGDYYNPGDTVVLETETAKLSPGGIILLHDGSQDTIDTLATFIRSCKRRGFRFVTLDELQR
jgi:peptidoglycan/xylan/chitin deacetylase (PgdA/CDA1 family)